MEGAGGGEEEVWTNLFLPTWQDDEALTPLYCRRLPSKKRRLATEAWRLASKERW